MTKASKPYRRIKQPLQGVEWVYANSWWDGPISGVVKYEGNRYYAQMVSENCKRRRRYEVRHLPPDAWAQEDAKHVLFREKVGTHMEYANGKRCGVVAPERTWHEFYESDLAKTVDPGAIAGLPVIGWFEE